jgi:outer membrane protein assembly factor BamB
MVRWRYRTSNPYNPMGPTTVGDDGTVYTLGGDLIAFDGITGALKWRGPSLGSGMEPPVIARDGTVYSGEGLLNAAIPPTNGSTGSQAWIFGDANAATSPAIGADGTLFVGSYDLRVSAVIPPAGGAGPALKWRYNTGCLAHAAPAIGPDGTVYVAGYDWDLLAFNPQTTNPNGELKWRWHQWVTRGLRSAPAVGADGTIYIAGFGHVYAITPPAGGGDGTLKWDFRTEGTQVSAPAIGADGTIYVTDESGILYAIQ